MDHTAAATLMAWLDREVWLITAHADSRRGGLIATFVNPASIVPDLPRMVIGLSRSHHTTALIEASGACALHLLGEQHLDLVWRFGLQSGRDVDKFAGLDLSVHGPTGSPILGDAIGWLDCRVEAPAGRRRPQPFPARGGPEPGDQLCSAVDAKASDAAGIPAPP